MIIITNAKYMKNELDEVCSIVATFNEVEWLFPIDPANRHYAEIMRQVEAGTLTIAEAD
jgi:hypothetical protein